MGVVLAIIAIAVLLPLIIASMRVRRGTRMSERHQADARANTGQAQHEDSLRRRAEVRATPTEPSGALPSHTDE
jgi:hypothetical protein